MKIIVASVILGMLTAFTGCSGSMMNKDHPMMGMHNMDLSDAEVLSILATANAGEITQAQTALPKLQTSQAKVFAQKMVDDHSANDQEAQSLASRLGISPRNNPFSMKLNEDNNDMVAKLNAAAMQDIDKTYMDCQVKAHKMVLSTIDKKLLPNAQNAELKSFLTQTRAAVVMHLQMVEQIKASL